MPKDNTSSYWNVMALRIHAVQLLGWITIIPSSKSDPSHLQIKSRSSHQRPYTPPSPSQHPQASSSAQNHKISIPSPSPETTYERTHVDCQIRPQPLHIRVLEINQNTRAALRTEPMRLQFSAHIVVLEFRLRVVEPNDVLAVGVDEQVAVRAAD